MKKILLSVFSVSALSLGLNAQTASDKSCNAASANNEAYIFNFNGLAADNCDANGGAPVYNIDTDQPDADYYNWTVGNGNLVITKDASKAPIADGWRGFKLGMYNGDCASKVNLDMTNATSVEIKITSTVAVPQFWIAFHDATNDKWTDNMPDFKALTVGVNTITYSLTGAEFWKSYAASNPPAVLKNNVDVFSMYFRTAYNDNNPSGTFTIDYIKIGNTSSIVCSNSVNEVSNVTNFTVFPSPATSEVNVKFSSVENATITLTDITGRVMVSEQVAAGTYNKAYDVTNFAQGLYFVTVSGANGQTTEKFMVK